jgi:arsenate reductase (thioredoxin)
MTKILILCTGNSCRSQMAEGFLNSFDPSLYVRSAGTNPSGNVHPKAVEVMKDINVDISAGKPENVNLYIKEPWDFVITVCGNAKETCPVFMGEVKESLHIGFDDPADATGSDEEIVKEFRRIRNEIKLDFYSFYKNRLYKNEGK